MSDPAHVGRRLPLRQLTTADRPLARRRRACAWIDVAQPSHAAPHDPPGAVGATQSLARAERYLMASPASTDLLSQSRRNPEAGEAADGLALGDEIAADQHRLGPGQHDQGMVN